MSSTISPERNYINQRLNCRIFYNEQISTQPPEKTLENKVTSIKNIVMNELNQSLGSTMNPY